MMSPQMLLSSRLRKGERRETEGTLKRPGVSPERGQVSNWKDTTEGFRCYEQSKCSQDAIQVMRFDEEYTWNE